MTKYFLKRLIYIFLIFIIITFLTYAIYALIPFDRAKVIANASKGQFQHDPHAAENLEELYQFHRTRLDLDKNIAQRYLIWMGLMRKHNGHYDGLLQGNLGVSYDNLEKPVVEYLRDPMKNTVFINIFATVLGLGITIPLGIFCAVKRGSKRDQAIQVGSIIGYSMPVFITAILFIFLFAIKLPIFPVCGTGTLGSDYTGLKWFGDKMYYLALPLIVMTFCSLGGMIRYVRASMIEALSMDCIRTARSKGLKEKVVIFSHAWRNALVPLVILVLGWFIGIFGGSIMIENIFDINGMGKAYINALNSNDFDVVLALQLFYVLIGLIGNFVADIIYGLVDPRIRVNK